MQKSLAFLVFILGVALASCGGGGGGSAPSVLPAAPGAPSNAGPAKSSQAQMVVHIPPLSQQGQARHPFYISSGTQSVGILIAPASGPTPSPVPTMQVFPVTTPSPCAAASGGGLTCTFVVQALYGNDTVTIYTYSVPNPNSSTVPLSVAQGSLTVTPGVSATAAPINVTLNAIISRASVSVPNPDPSNTPNTQLYTAGVAATVPLSINAYDASGNSVLSDPTTPFTSPVTVTLPSANGGFSFGYAPSCASGSSSSSNSITIGCAGDLSKATLVYNGSVSTDANNHIIDAVAITPSIGATTATGGDVAHAVLQSNILTYPLSVSVGTITPGSQLINLPNGDVAYLVVGSAGWTTGVFSPATGAVTPGVTSTTGHPQAVAISPDGTSIWTVDQGPGPIRCWTSTATIGSAPAQTYNLTTSLSYPIRVRNIAFDKSGNLWYEGIDQSVSGNWAGYIPVSANCGGPVSAPAAQIAITGTTGDYTLPFVATSNGAIWTGATTGLYVMNTSTSTVSAIAPATGISTYGTIAGLALDNAGTAYFVNNWTDLTTYHSDLEKLTSGSSTPISMLTLVPGSGMSSIHPNVPSSNINGAISVFSKSGSADRLTYVDGSLSALGIVDSLQSTPVSQLVPLPVSMSATTFTSTGEPLILGMNAGVPTIARVLATTTWNVPVLTYTPMCGSMPFGVLQRGSGSGPFTISTTGGVTSAQFPAPDTNNAWLSGSTAGPFTITVTDASGRARTFSATLNANYCP